MYTSIPESMRGQFGLNVTIPELEAVLVTLHIPAIIFMTLLTVVGVIGNGFVLVIYSRYRPSFFRVYILWLAVVDFITCAVFGPILIYSLFNPYDFNYNGACKAVRFTQIWLVMTSSSLFLFISIERYRSICGTSRVVTKDRRVIQMCIGATAIGLASALPALFVFGVQNVNTGVEYNRYGKECFRDNSLLDTWYPVAYFGLFLVMFVVCVGIILVLYTKIAIRLTSHRHFNREHVKKSATGNGVAKVDKASRRGISSADKLSMKITKMFFVITLFYILTFLPYCILLLISEINTDFKKNMSPAGVAFYNVGFRSFAINNSINPIIYIVWQRNFRMDCVALFWKIITCGLRRNDVTVDSRTDSVLTTDISITIDVKAPTLTERDKTTTQFFEQCDNDLDLKDKCAPAEPSICNEEDRNCASISVTDNKTLITIHSTRQESHSFS